MPSDPDELYEKYKKQISKDVIIDPFNIPEQMANWPNLMNGWLIIYSDAKRELLRLTHEKRDVLYDGLRNNPAQVTKVVMNKMLENSKEIRELTKHIERQEFLVEFLHDEIFQLWNKMSWIFKGFTDQVKAENLIY